MKKLMSILLLFAMLLSLCACGAEESTQATTVATNPAEETTAPAEEELSGPQLLKPEDLYGHINQLEPVDGVYKIWNEVGVQNMADHPEGEFTLLCNVDMQGATVRPIGTTEKPFTGKISGGNFTISNFTVQGENDESFGFVGVNEGLIQNLALDQVTFVPNENAKNIGAFVGLNKGEVARNNILSATMVVDAAADGAACGSAVGVNSGKLVNNDVTVDLAFNSTGSAAVGGLVGKSENGTMEYCSTFGKLEIQGENKTVGLMVGEGNDLKITECVFVGAANTLNGQIFDQYYGAGENTEAVNCLRRDNHTEPMSEKEAELRDRVVEEMRRMGTIEWKVDRELTHSCSCSYAGCYTTYTPKYIYVGLPYNHYASPYEQAAYFVDENGYAKDWAFEMDDRGGYDMYIGSDCSASVQLAWWTVSNSSEFFRTGGMLPSLGLGCLPVGDYEWDFYLEGSGGYKTEYTNKMTIATGEQRMYEAYGEMRRGDAIMYQIEAGGHARLCSSDAVVVRDDQGNINPEFSYVLMHEQGAGFTDESTGFKTTWRIDYKYTFANLYYDGAIPVTCEELKSGEMEPVECELVNGASGYAGMFSGEVKSNYQINAVILTIKDSAGNVAFERPYYPSVERGSDYGTYHHKARGLNLKVEMASFATILQDAQFQKGETYSYTVVASLATGDQFELRNDTFTLGTAQ